MAQQISHRGGGGGRPDFLSRRPAGAAERLPSTPRSETKVLKTAALHTMANSISQGAISTIMAGSTGANGYNPVVQVRVSEPAGFKKCWIKIAAERGAWMSVSLVGRRFSEDCGRLRTK